LIVNFHRHSDAAPMEVIILVVVV